MKIVDKDNMSSVVRKVRNLIKTTSQNTINAARLLFQPREAGKGLSSNDFTDADKAKLDKMDIIFIDIPQNFPESPTKEEFLRLAGMTLNEIYKKAQAGTPIIVRHYITISNDPMPIISQVSSTWQSVDDNTLCYLSGTYENITYTIIFIEKGGNYAYGNGQIEVLLESRITQYTGNSSQTVMSQKAVTDALNNLVLVVNGLIPTGTAITRSTLDALGLTSQVINNIMAGKYSKIEMHVDSQNRVIYNYSAILQGGQKKIILEKMEYCEGYSIVANSNGTFNIQLIR